MLVRMLTFAVVPYTRRVGVRQFVTVEELNKWKVADLRRELGDRGIEWGSYFDKADLVQAVAQVFEKEKGFSTSGLLVPGRVKEVTGAQLEVEIQDDASPLLVDVFATWCGPCQLMAPELEKAAKDLGMRARVVKLDSDKEPELASRLNIGGLPTVLVFKGGKELQRVEGAVMADQIVGMIDTLH